MYLFKTKVNDEDVFVSAENYYIAEQKVNNFILAKIKEDNKHEQNGGVVKNNYKIENIKLRQVKCNFLS